MAHEWSRTAEQNKDAATGAHRETVRKRLASLVKKGFLVLDGKGRGAGYRKR